MDTHTSPTPDLLHLYHQIFGAPDAAARVTRLREALGAIDPYDVAGTRGGVDALVDSCDVAPLGEEQLLLLRRAWSSSEMAALAPGERSPEAGTELATEATAAIRTERLVRFWRNLLADIGQARALQTLLGAWHQGRTDPQRRAALAHKLHELDPTEPWSDAQIEALVTLLVADIRFQAVSPWSMPGNAW